MQCRNSPECEPVSKEMFEYFAEVTREKFAELVAKHEKTDAKLDTLMGFHWKVAGATSVLVFLLTIVAQALIRVLS